MGFVWIIITALIIGADRITKIFAQTYISGGSIEAIPGVFSLVYVKNTGAAFSMLEDKTWLLSIISIVFCIFVAVYYIMKKPRSRLLCSAGTLVFAGALGNAIDRIFYGYVVDFIKTDFIEFPVFNIADIAITVGAVLLMIYVIFFDSRENG